MPTQCKEASQKKFRFGFSNCFRGHEPSSAYVISNARPVTNQYLEISNYNLDLLNIWALRRVRVKKNTSQCNSWALF